MQEDSQMGPLSLDMLMSEWSEHQNLEHTGLLGAVMGE